MRSLFFVQVGNFPARFQVLQLAFVMTIKEIVTFTVSGSSTLTLGCVKTDPHYLEPHIAVGVTVQNWVLLQASRYAFTEASPAPV